MALGKKTGGRKKGTPNKSSLSASTILEKLDFNALDEMVTLYRQLKAEGELNTAGGLLKEIASYQFPKRKAIEVTAETDSTVNVKWKS